MAAPTANIADVIARCLDAFSQIIVKFKSEDAQAHTRVESCQTRFRLWAGTMGAHQSSGGKSLEYRLRDTSWIKKHLLGLLNQLLDDLLKRTHTKPYRV
jgi:hypothetical protein